MSVKACDASTSHHGLPQRPMSPPRNNRVFLSTRTPPTPQSYYAELYSSSTSRIPNDSQSTITSTEPPLPTPPEKSNIEADVIPIVLCLLHDCFAILENLHRGNPPISPFQDRYYLLSLSIAVNGIRKYEEPLKRSWQMPLYTAMDKLVMLRHRIMFTTAAVDHKHERAVLSEIISPLAVAPIRCIDRAALPRFRTIIALTVNSTDPRAIIRSFLRIPPWTSRGVTFDAPVEVTPLRELGLLTDALRALHGLFPDTPRCAGGLKSLRIDHRLSTYPANNRSLKSLVLARDTICGLLPGVEALDVEGAFRMYLKFVLETRSEWQLYKDVTPEDKDILESVLSTFMAVFESKEAMEVQHDVLTKVIIVLQVLKTRAYLQPANSREKTDGQSSSKEASPTTPRASRTLSRRTRADFKE